jgi:aminoglycoside 6'-N-acetyltransferase
VEAVGFRPMQRADLPLLARWLAAPHVSMWWRQEPSNLAEVEAKYGPCIDGDDPTELFVVSVAARPVGMIQRYLIADEPEWARVFAGITDVSAAAGIDYLIGEPDMVGRGVGTATITGFVTKVFRWRPVDVVVVSVQQANTSSWRALESAGFRRVWAGELDSPDPSDDGPEYVYVIGRPARPATGSP